MGHVPHQALQSKSDIEKNVQVTFHKLHWLIKMPVKRSSNEKQIKIGLIKSEETKNAHIYL